MNIITGEAHHYTNIDTEQRITLPSSLIQYIYSCDYYFIIILLPFEPTLFPKLQVYFADFPYLCYAINHQRLLTLRTWCGYRYEMAWKWFEFVQQHIIFQGAITIHSYWRQ